MISHPYHLFSLNSNWQRVQNVEFALIDLRMAMVVPPLLLSSELLGTIFVELKFHSVHHCL